jgi:hypothetical protein
MVLVSRSPMSSPVPSVADSFAAPPSVESYDKVSSPSLTRLEEKRRQVALQRQQLERRISNLVSPREIPSPVIKAKGISKNVGQALLKKLPTVPFLDEESQGPPYPLESQSKNQRASMVCLSLRSLVAKEEERLALRRLTLPSSSSSVLKPPKLALPGALRASYSTIVPPRKAQIKRVRWSLPPLSSSTPPGCSHSSRKILSPLQPSPRAIWEL